MLLLGLCLGQDFLGVVLPEAIRHRIQADAITGALAQQISAQFFQETPDWSKSLAGVRFRLRERERWRGKVQYGVRFMLTPNSSRPAATVTCGAVLLATAYASVGRP